MRARARARVRARARARVRVRQYRSSLDFSRTPRVLNRRGRSGVNRADTT